MSRFSATAIPAGSAPPRIDPLRYPVLVSPTIFRVAGFRFFFFSREESRAHVHVEHADGEAKFWITPMVELATNHGLKPTQLAAVERLIEEHIDEIRHAWAKHFKC